MRLSNERKATPVRALAPSARAPDAGAPRKDLRAIETAALEIGATELQIVHSLSAWDVIEDMPGQVSGLQYCGRRQRAL